MEATEMNEAQGTKTGTNWGPGRKSARGSVKPRVRSIYGCSSGDQRGQLAGGLMPWPVRYAQGQLMCAPAPKRSVLLSLCSLRRRLRHELLFRNEPGKFDRTG